MHVFSMPVVSNAGFYYYLGRTQTMKMIKNEETRRQWSFFRNKTQTFNSCRSLDYARDNGSTIICFNDLYKNGNLTIFSCTSAKMKIFWELSTPSTHYFKIVWLRMSLAPVVLSPALTDWLWRIQLNKTLRNNESRKRWPQSQSET